MPDKPLHVLFLCTGNSARSILAEAVMNRAGEGRFIAHSAGSRPTGVPNPFAIDLLRREGFDTGFARSKSWDEFAVPDAPKLDFVFTVCDQAAATGSDAEKAVAFAETYRMLNRRLQAFAALPLVTLDALGLRSKLTEIGQTE